MAMLAERKSKTKWCLNPRGKEWSQDSNKFGQKLLEKMGWKVGKGLGKQENGVTEHIKVSLKSDSKGLGFKEDQNPWTENEQNFSSLLQTLSANVTTDSKIKVNSLEKKSESSRARVHYRKFTRSKDLSRYSAKDLACIFGKTNIEESKGLDNPGLNLSIDDHPEDGIGTSNPALELSTDDSGIEQPQQEITRENDLNLEKPKKKKKGLDNPCLELSDQDLENQPKKKKKRLDNPCLELSDPDSENRVKKKKKGLDNPCLELSDQDLENQPKKKKKKLDNPCLELSDSDSENRVKKKKNGLDNPCLELSDQDLENRPKKKNKGLDNPCLELSDQDLENRPKKKKRKKVEGIDNAGLELDEDKLKKKKRKLEQGLDNPGLNISDPVGLDNPGSNLSYEEPKKKKKKKVEVFTPKSALKRSGFGEKRKSVQINESLNQEKVITDSDQSLNSSREVSLSTAIENLQSEVDNSINEKKLNVEYGGQKFKHIVASELNHGRCSIQFPGVQLESIRGYGVDV